MSWVAMVLGASVVLWGRYGDRWGCRADVSVRKDGLDLTTIDVHQLATHAHGTEILLLENRYRDQPGYRFEDFFWTGSGDEPDENHWSDKTEIMYETKTVVSTVFIELPQSSLNESSRNKSQCVHSCDTPATMPEDKITPSPTVSDPTQMVPEQDDGFSADRQFWLITVLKTGGTDPVISDLKTSLEKLYRKAFERQHERHLGIGYRLKRYSKEQPVSVHIHKLAKSALDGDQKVEVLYQVSVSGKPVPAVTAANDMNFVTDEEVQEMLGYPFIVKAKPYLKPVEPQSLSSAKNTWIFIGISILAFLVMLLIVAFITLGCTKRKRMASPAGMGTDNKQQAFAKEGGLGNQAFVDETGKAGSPTYIKFKNENSTLSKSTGVCRATGSISSTSSSSTSLDISPLMHSKKKVPFKKSYRPKAAINKTMPSAFSTGERPAEIFDSDSSSSRRDSSDTIFLAGNYDPGVVSPKSYLSMPSIKSFPKGNMPEPLNRVLEPVSVLNLDIPEGETEYEDKRYRLGMGLIRHGSAGTVEDPGVLGPIVWNVHCQRLQHGVSVDEGISDLKEANISRMRKRFYDLLDDTFSLFGSRKGSPVDKRCIGVQSRQRQSEAKSHSAANSRSGDDLKASTPRQRPKTTDLRKADHHPTPKGAWSSKAPSPLIRPLSACVVNPRTPGVNVDHIMSEGRFRADDPAVSLIRTIKSEIEKVSLPGSTTDLRN